MSIQSLNPPQDIAWNRIAYSTDMIDKNFGDLNFPRKWRSSLAVYYSIVPEEETADAYPNTRIVYLRLTCSITGWNAYEDLLNASGKMSDNSDDMQLSIWETIFSEGWASVYWPCLGAIMQIAVYPPIGSTVDTDDYPEIMDFEPKKRELYESVTAGNEVLSGSSDKTSIGKSSTNVFSGEIEASGSIAGIFGETMKAGFSHQSVETTTTDKSRENRETKSRTTSFSNMYQLFNGYHLGTNRAVFVVAPRPHTASAGFALIDESGGGRRLEGIQDVFLVVNVPKKLNGFCVQASIDTGHKLMASNMRAMERRYESEEDKQDGPGHDPDDNSDPDDNGNPTGNGSGSPDNKYNQLIVTRRIVKNCGKFDDNGNFTISRATSTGTGTPPTGPVVVWERSYPATKNNTDEVSLASAGTDTIKAQATRARYLNINQQRFIKSMISGFSAGNFEPLEFSKTKTFRTLVRGSLQKLSSPVDKLVELKYLTADEANHLMRGRIMTVGDIFKNNMGQSRDPEIRKLREKILGKAGISKPHGKLSNHVGGSKTSH